jgi:hypothetical protein
LSHLCSLYVYVNPNNNPITPDRLHEFLRRSLRSSALVTLGRVINSPYLLSFMRQSVRPSALATLGRNINLPVAMLTAARSGAQVTMPAMATTRVCWAVNYMDKFNE